MPNPTSSDLHVDGVRQELSIAYVNDRNFLAGDAIAPIVNVDKQSDLYAKWSRADFLRLQMGLVADGDPAPQMSYGVATESYFCNVYGGKKIITDRQRAQARNEFALEESVIRFLNEQALLRREKLIADTLFTTGIWGTDATPGTLWSASSSDPYGDIETGMDAVHLATGQYPTDFVVGKDVWATLKHHADTLDRVKGGATSTDPARVLPEQVAAVIGVKRLTIAGAVYNSASAGASVSMAQLYDTNDALLVYRPDTPEQFSPSGAYTFSWSEFDNVDATAAQIRTWREDDPMGEWFHGQMAIAPKLTATEAGYFFNEATS
jgi:hypothetical protein